MGSISGRFSGIGSAINNSIARVGQPLLGALIFIAMSATYYASLGSAAGLDTGRPGRPHRVPAAQPPVAGATAEQIAASNQASMEAFHLAMLAAPGPGDRAHSWRGTACAKAPDAPAGRPSSPPLRPPDDEAMTRDWDARTYDRVADPQTRWGTAVLDRLPLAGDERVLDAGCGSGRVTELLAKRLPRGRVVALDGSPSMIEAARERLAPFGDRIEYVVADLGRRCRSRGRSMRSCRPRPSTGSPTTTRCSGTWPRSCDRAAGSSRSAAASATSSRSSVSWRRSATAGSARPTTRRRWPRSADSTRPASSTSNAG